MAARILALSGLGLLLIVTLPVSDAQVPFPQSAADVCKYSQQTSKRCLIPVSIGGINKHLFTDSNLGQVANQCRMDEHTIPAVINKTAGFTKWKVDFITFVIFHSRCGLLLKPKQIPPEDIVSAINLYLNWTPGIPQHNCRMVGRFLENLFLFGNALLALGATIDNLPTATVLHILAVMPPKLCIIASKLGGFSPQTVEHLVDGLASDCQSMNALSRFAKCSWRTRHQPRTTIIEAMEEGSGTRVCVDPNADHQCFTNVICIKALCYMDLKNRNCTSPCAQLKHVKGCEQPPDPSVRAQCSRRKPDNAKPPNPTTATADDLYEVACCLFRRRNGWALYPKELLCTLEAEKIDKKCRNKFIALQMTFAPLCADCATVSHSMALLSPNCSLKSIQSDLTTIEQVKDLIRATKGKKMMFRLLRNIYMHLDRQLRDLVCINGMMSVVTVAEVKAIGYSNLQPVLQEMTKCEQPPERPKMLAILDGGITCPTSILLTSGRKLIQQGALTDKCLMSLKLDQALDVCSLLMATQDTPLSPWKVRILCKALDKLESTTCILCPLKLKDGKNEKQERVIPDPEVQVRRCTGIKKVKPEQRTPDQKAELLLCKPCKVTKTETEGEMQEVKSWCSAKNVTEEDIQNLQGDICSLPCQQLKCLFKHAQRLLQLAQQGNKTYGEYSNMYYLRTLLFPETIDESDVEEEHRFNCAARCPAFIHILKDHIRERPRRDDRPHQPDDRSSERPDRPDKPNNTPKTVHGRRKRSEAACDTDEFIKSFDRTGVSISSFLNPNDVACLKPLQTVDLIKDHNLNLENWTPQEAKLLLGKVLMASGKSIAELSAAEVKSLGLILVALTPDELTSLKAIDAPLYGLLGSSPYWTRSQMYSLVQRYFKEMERSAANLTLDDLLTLQNMIVGFTPEEIGLIQNERMKGAIPVLGAIPICDQQLLEAFVKHLIQAHGAIDTWDESQLAEDFNLLGGLSAGEINTAGPRIVSYIADNAWLYNTNEEKLTQLSESVKENLSERQHQLARTKSPRCDGVVTYQNPAHKDTNMISAGIGTKQIRDCTLAAMLLGILLIIVI